jgi:hypothetical protein
MTPAEVYAGTSHNSSLMLLCLVEGDSVTFPVTVSSEDTIFQLKAAVHASNDKGLFRDVNVMNLELLRASKFSGVSVRVMAHIATPLGRCRPRTV